MRDVIQLGDSTSHGGKVITARDHSRVMDRAVACVGDHCACPMSDHHDCVIVEGDEAVKIDGRAVAFDGHKTSCGATLISSVEIVRADVSTQEIRSMRRQFKRGLWVVLGVAVLAPVLALASVLSWADQPSKAPGAASGISNPAKARVLAGAGPQYALEIRAVGLAITGRQQDTVWKQIQAKNDNFSSILSNDPNRYGANPDQRRIFSRIASAAAYRYAAGEAVDHWPVPEIILGPPRGEHTTYKTEYGIADGQQDAGLGVTEFLFLSAHNSTTAAPALTQLFQFFDTHPDVPAVLILSQDGMQYRWALETPGTPKEPPGAFVPSVQDSMSGLLVTRSDRVDHLVRPFAVNVPADIDTRKTQYDVVKQWNFYWKKNEQFQREMDTAAGGHSTGSYTMKSDWWISKLPELWSRVENKGPGDFKPSPFLPVRWANWQVDEFDEAPLLGYLHRPVEIKLTDDKGKELKRAQQVSALQDGWKEAMATLPTGTKPSRVFYDTTLSRDWVIPITQALHNNAQGIDVGDVKEGYDIGRRIGNTGVSSALVQIYLATISNYEDGGASATINLMGNGTASIVMVSPPDDASKANNRKHRGPDPFMYRSN